MKKYHTFYLLEFMRYALLVVMFTGIFIIGGAALTYSDEDMQYHKSLSMSTGDRKLIVFDDTYKLETWLSNCNEDDMSPNIHEIIQTDSGLVVIFSF